MNRMTAGASSFLDPLQLIPTLGVVIGMVAGLYGIYNSIKARQRETKQDIEKSIISSEDRLKEFFEVRFKVVDAITVAINQRLDRQLGDLKEQIKDHSETITKRISERETFFKDWIQRVEDEVDTNRHSRTQKK